MVARVFSAAVVSCAFFFVGCPGPATEGEGEGEGEDLPVCDERDLTAEESSDERGVLVVLAGEGGVGFVDGEGSDVRFNGIGGVARGDGFFVVSDIFNATLRKITDDGTVTTLLGEPLDFGTVDGACSTVRMNGPRGVVVDPRDGTVWFGDGPCLRHADLTTGETTTVAGNCATGGYADGPLRDSRFGFLFHDVELDPDTGRLYVSDRVNNRIREIDIEAGTVATLADAFSAPGGMAFDKDARTLFVADTELNKILSVNVDTGDVETVAGTGVAGSDDGPVATATLNAPQTLALTGTRLVFGGLDGVLRSVDLVDAEVSTLGSGFAGFFAPMGNFDDGDERLMIGDGDGALRILDGNALAYVAGADAPVGYADGAGDEARFSLPASIVARGDGESVFVTDSFNNAIRIVSLSDGTTSTLIGSPDRGGNVDGSFADAELFFPSGLARDAAGTTLYVAADGADEVKKLDLVNETVTTVATLNDPWEVALDEANQKLYVVSSADGKLLEVDLAAETQRLVPVSFSFPVGVAVAGGSVFVTDNPAHQLFEVDVVAGTKTAVLGTNGFQGPVAGTSDEALLSFPSSLSTNVENGEDVLYIAETGGQVVRRVLLSDFSSTFVVGNPKKSGALSAGSRVTLDSAPILNPQDAVAIGDDVVIAGDTTIVVARP